MNKLSEFSEETKAKSYEQLLIDKELNDKHVFSYEISIRKNKEKLKQLKIQESAFSKVEDDEESINQEIFELKEELTYNTLKQYLASQEKLSTEYTLQKQKLDDVQSELDGEVVTDIQLYTLNKEKDSITNFLIQNEQNLAILNKKILTYIEKYVPYKKKLKVEEELSEIKKNNILIETTLKNLYILREKCRQAEFLSIEETVESLNIQSKYYLDKMFPNTSIEVRLENYRPTGKGKNVKTKGQMNMTIFYKNNEYDSIGQLSGGEKDRVNFCIYF